MPMSPGMRVLIVDDDVDRATRLATALAGVGYAVSLRDNSLEGLVAVEDEQPALVILDWGLPFIDATTFLHALRAGLPIPPPVVALLDAATDPAAAARAGARASLHTAADPNEIVQLVRALLPPPASIA